jgi:hypothetical protein
MDDDVRFTLRVPKALHDQATQAVGRQRGQSLNNFVVDVLSNHIGGPKSVETALRQAEAALRSARNLFREEKRRQRLADRHHRHLFVSFQILGDLAEEKGVTQGQLDEVIAARFDEVASRYKEHAEAREKWIDEWIKAEDEEHKKRMEELDAQIHSRMSE